METFIKEINLHAKISEKEEERKHKTNLSNKVRNFQFKNHGTCKIRILQVQGP